MQYLKKIVLLILFCVLFTGCSKDNKVEEEIPVYGYEPTEDTEVLVENNDLELHFNTETTQFFVVKKSSGDTWYSNPLNAAEDSKADNASKELLQSTLSIKYSTAAGVTTTLNNFGYSITKGIYNYEILDSGIKVNYSIGNIERTYYIPIAVPESRMMEFYEKMEKSDQRKVDEYYRRYDINKLRATDDKDALLAKYPDLANERVYILRDSIAAYLKVNIENIFQNVGYTSVDYETDLARYSTVTSNNNPVFNVSVLYELKDDNLIVSVPYENIQFRDEYPITEIKVLPYFGAAGTADSGYLMVPDGSGGLIHFNNGKSDQSAYFNTVYGWDYAQSRDALVDENRAVFPVFGIAKNNASMICILEDGAPYATIEADVSGRLHSYNYACAAYTVVHGELMDISSKSDKTVIVYEDGLPKESIKQRYHFIDSNRYVDMAKEYREYLLDQYPDMVKEEEKELPVAVEIIGATDRVKQKFGFPMTVAEALTTYKEAANMVNQLSDAGFTNMSINYNGWFNQGVIHKVPSSVNLIRELGSEKDFKKMIESIEDTGSDLYLQGSFEFIYKNKLFDGFYANRDAAKLVSRELVELYPYSSVWYGLRENHDLKYYLAKPSYTMKLIDSFSNSIHKLGVENISFGDIGKYLGADYNPKHTVSRQEVMKMQMEKLQELSDLGSKIMTYTGNSYVLPYADFILDMKLDSKGFNIIDEEVPFLPIALHGLIPYTGKAINLAEDYTKNLLKSIETGAGLYFVFMDEPTATLQESGYTEYFGSDFDLWFNNSTELYQDLKLKLNHIYNQLIIDHQKVDENVFITTYEDGTKVIVNYSSMDYEYNGNTVPAENFFVEGGSY